MNYTEKKILVIGAGELQIPLITTARKLGIFVIASDQNPQAPGFEYANDHIIANTLDPTESTEKILSYLKKNNTVLDGVVTSGTDASYTVAIIAKKLNLPGHNPDAALKASHKVLMRNALQEHNIPIPQYKKISSLTEAQVFFETIQKPCVIKPTQNMGARGISLVKSIKDLENAFYLAQKYSQNQDEYLIEEYIDAHELSLDALISNNHITITGVADRIIEYSPYFVETGHILPSCLDKTLIDKAIATFKDGINALGLSHGAAKCDLKISEHQTWIIEIAARLSGGFMSSHTFPFATGIPLHKHMVLLALGEKIQNIKSTKNWVSIERAIIAPPGIITDISIPDDLLEYDYISHVSIRSKIGDISVSPKNNLDKIGNIIATAPSRELAIRSVNNAIQNIKISINDSVHKLTTLEHSNSNAKKLLTQCCHVCRYCDGIWCRGKIPGVGGVGTGEGFIQAYERFRQIKIIPSYIHNIREVDTSLQMFGKTFSMPVFTAPISGAGINYNHAVTELELQQALVKGAYQAGTMAFTPDPAPPEFFVHVTKTILENYGHSISICKPRNDLQDIHNRYQQAIAVGAIGIGTDIDGIGIQTFTQIGQKTCPKNIEELKKIHEYYNIPFVIKGVLSVSDALYAIEAGATHIIVSSHGGRIGEAFPIPIDVLTPIKKAVNGRIPILIDGAIRSGSDVIKTILLGADAALIGRPVATHAIGGGYYAVKTYLETIKDQIQTQMILLGVSSIEDLKNRPELLQKLHH